MLIVNWFKWVFSNSGIAYSTRSPIRIHIWKRWGLIINRHTGVDCRPDGPTAEDLAKWMKSGILTGFGGVLKEYVCQVCHTHIWAYKRVRVCEQFRCFNKAGGWNKKMRRSK